MDNVSKANLEYMQSYIDDFTEAEYQEYLRNPQALSVLSRLYLVDSNVRNLAVKESLDHYVKKRLLEDESFINSQEFANYLQYILDIDSKKQNPSINNHLISMELATNTVFQNETLRKKIFAKLGSTIEGKYLLDKREIDDIFRRMRENILLDGNALLIAAEYLYRSRDLQGDKADVFLKYIFNRGSQIEINNSWLIVAAICSIAPKYYTLDEDARKCRFFVADYSEAKKEIFSATSFADQNICALRKSKAKKTSLGGRESLRYQRSAKSNDILHVLFVAFHELTHKHQEADMRKNKMTSSALSYLIYKQLKNICYQWWKMSIFDYSKNHDAYELEMEADEEGWRQAFALISKIIADKELREEMLRQISSHITKVKTRRAFMQKISPEDAFNSETAEEEVKKSIYYYDYDTVHLIEKMQTMSKEDRLKVFTEFPILRKLFDEKGNLKVFDIMSSYQAYNYREDGLIDYLDIYSGNAQNIDYNNGLLVFTSYIVFNDKEWNRLKKALGTGSINSNNVVGMLKILGNMVAVIRNSMQKVILFHEVSSLSSAEFSQAFQNIQTRFNYRSKKAIKNIYQRHFSNIITGVIRYYQYRTLVGRIFTTTQSELEIPDMMEEIIRNTTGIVQLLKGKINVKDDLERLNQSQIPDCMNIYNSIMAGLTPEKKNAQGK